MLPMSVRENLTIATLDQFRRGLLIDGGKERQAVDEIVRRMQIKAVLDLPVATLSGGNQQKVAIGKWLMTRPRVLLLCDPTRGIDVGTKQEIYRLLRELAADGTAILFYTTDYDELIGLCDRVLVFYGGRGLCCTGQQTVAVRPSPLPVTGGGRTLDARAPASGSAH
jgi:ribose transport system ATP-binding protein